MKIDYDNKNFKLRGVEYGFDEFKAWFESNYPMLLGGYRVVDRIDWQSILADIQSNGILEIYENYKLLQ